ncbi:MAG: putative LPS assembly protein LptD, partial [Rikenellaceae bacterium]
MNKIKLKYLFSTLIALSAIGATLSSNPTKVVAATLSQESSSTLNIELDSLDVISPLDSIPQDATPQDSITEVILTDSIANDSLKPKAKKSFLDDRLDGKNTDSLFYDVKNKMVYIYNEGDVTYQNKNLKADFMQVNMDSREIFAYGKKDTVNGALTTIKPVFTDGGTSYTMDTITYNLKSEKARIKGVAVQEGEGWLIGNNVKKMPDNTINITEGKYTTCDNVEHPHFYLAMSKAKVIPNDKVVTGYAYMVLADVPLPFLAIPEGFFPLNMEYKSGLLMPSYGEDSSRGFFLRDLGYYLILNDHADVTLLAGIYSLGSWEASVSSRYVKRYKYSGNLSFNYSNVKVGLSTDPDYTEQNAYKVVWSHTQDAKANPSSSFSASVNFTTSGYTAYAATTISDMLATQ